MPKTSALDHSATLPNHENVILTVLIIDATALKKLEMRGVEPRTFHMRSELSTTELHPVDLQISDNDNEVLYSIHL